jgi:hypothetical protein
MRWVDTTTSDRELIYDTSNKRPFDFAAYYAATLRVTGETKAVEENHSY